MKLTKATLKRIIKEELDNFNQDDFNRNRDLEVMIEKIDMILYLIKTYGAENVEKYYKEIEAIKSRR